ncbi:MAG: DNA-binding transcriptional LysR family regulator [Thermoproteota archaeon]|jgi:DNA-binding transcriptional LysR family regulator
MNLPSLYDISYFKGVADEKSFSGAAKKVGISQPSLSLAIKRLEENFGMNLFVRSKKGVELTKEGVFFYSKACGLLGQWDDIYNEVTKKKDELKGTFKFGVHTSIALYSLGEITAKLIKKYPELQLEFSHDSSRVVNDMVLKCELDFGIVVNPIRHPDLTIVKVFEDEVKFWKSKKLNTLNDMKSDELVLICDKDLSQSQDLLKKIGKNVKIKRYITSNSLEVVAELTSQGMGVGIIPERVVNKFSGSKLNSIEKTPVFKDEMYFVYRRDFIHSVAFAKLKDMFVEHLKQQ